MAWQGHYTPYSFKCTKWPQTSFHRPDVDLVNQGVNLAWQLEHHELYCLLGQPMTQHADRETTLLTSSAVHWSRGIKFCEKKSGWNLKTWPVAPALHYASHPTKEWHQSSGSKHQEQRYIVMSIMMVVCTMRSHAVMVPQHWNRCSLYECSNQESRGWWICWSDTPELLDKLASS